MFPRPNRPTVPARRSIVKSKTEKIEEALKWARANRFYENVEKSSALKTLAYRVVRAEAELEEIKQAQRRTP